MPERFKLKCDSQCNRLNREFIIRLIFEIRKKPQETSNGFFISGFFFPEPWLLVLNLGFFLTIPNKISKSYSLMYDAAFAKLYL